MFVQLGQTSFIIRKIAAGSSRRYEKNRVKCNVDFGNSKEIIVQ